MITYITSLNRTQTHTHLPTHCRDWSYKEPEKDILYCHCFHSPFPTCRILLRAHPSCQNPSIRHQGEVRRSAFGRTRKDILLSLTLLSDKPHSLDQKKKLPSALREAEMGGSEEKVECIWKLEWSRIWMTEFIELLSRCILIQGYQRHVTVTWDIVYEFFTSFSHWAHFLWSERECYCSLCPLQHLSGFWFQNQLILSNPRPSVEHVCCRN